MFDWLGSIPHGALAGLGGVFVAVLLYLWRRDHAKLSRIAVPTSIDVTPREPALSTLAASAVRRVAQDLTPAPPARDAVTVVNPTARPVRLVRDEAGEINITIL